MQFLTKLTIIFFISFKTYAYSVVERGVSIGYPFCAKHEPGLEFMSINAYLSHPAGRNGELSKNTYSHIPTFIYNKPGVFLNGQLQVHVAFPSVVFEKGPDTQNWHAGVYNPFGIAGVAWDLFQGWSFSNSVGGFTPWQGSPTDYNGWVFVDALGLSHYDENDHDLSATLFLGFPGPDRKVKERLDANFANLNLTATKIVNHIEFGPIGYFTSDFNYSIIQKQFALGGLVGFYFKDFYIQAWYSHDTYQKNYQSPHSGGFVRLTFALDRPNAHRTHHQHHCYQLHNCQTS